MLRCNSAASDESSQESPDAESLFVPINQLLDEIKTLEGIAGTEAIVEKAERLSTYIHTGWDLKRNVPLTKAPAPSRGPAVEVTPLTCVLRTNTPDGRREYKPMTVRALRDVTAFAVGALTDLNFGGAYNAKLVVWLHAIANGGNVVEHEHRENANQYLPAITAVKAEVHFTEE